MTEPEQRAGPPVVIRLLGGPEVVGPAGAMDLRHLGRRGSVLLARLAVADGRPVSRRALADALWGDPPPASWPAALRNVVASARRALDSAGLPGCLHAEVAKAGYTLRLPADADIDVLRLRADVAEAEQAHRGDDDAARARELAEAVVARATGEVLPGGAEQWVEALRMEITELRARALRVAGDAALAVGDPEAAESLGRELVAAAPMREDGHRLLMRALAAGGNRAAALDAYAACRRLLGERLGAAPSEQTQDLFMALLAEDRAGPASASVVPEELALRGSLLLASRQRPFVGRVRLLEELARRLRLARSGGMLVSVVSGEAGLGKTRLAAELARRAAGEGTGVLYARADDRLDVPYAIWLHALDAPLSRWSGPERAARLGRHCTVLERWLPSLSDGTPAPPNPAHLTVAISAAVRALSAGGLLLVLDDVQWATRAELGVLGALLADAHETPAMVLALERTAADARVSAAIGSDVRVARNRLDPLAVPELEQLLRREATGPTGDITQAAVQLWRASGGNPLLAFTLLRSRRHGDAHARPARIEDLVRALLAGLPREAVDLLRLAAVAGLEFDPPTVATAAQLSEAQARRLLELATRAEVLIADRERLEFRHGLIRDVLVDGLPAAERRRVHERLALAATAVADHDPSARTQVAYHLGAVGPSGDWRRALRYSLPVARAAYQAGVYEDVLTVAGRMISTLAQADDPDPSARLDLQILLGGAQRALGDPAGHQTLDVAFTAAQQRDDSIRMADAVLAMSHTPALSDELSVDDRILDRYQHALDRLASTDPARRARLLARLAGAHAWRLSGTASRQAADEALALARELDDPAALASVLARSRRAATGSGDLAYQQRLETELLTLTDGLDDPGLRVIAALCQFDTAVQLGQGDRLESLLHAAATDARSLAAGSYHHSLAYSHACLALLRGHVLDAETLVARAALIGTHRGLDATVVEAVQLAQLLLVRIEQQRLDELREPAARLFGPSGIPAWAGVLAYIDAQCGRLDNVAERLDVMIDQFARLGPTATCTVGQMALMAAPVVELGDRGRTQQLYALIAPYAGQGGMLAAFAGPVDYHLGLLAESLDDHADAERRFTAARAFCERLGAPRWTARCSSAIASLAS